MRRSILFGIFGLGFIGLAWWFWGSRETSEKTSTTKVTPVANFSTLQSPAFAANEEIPKKYTCDGENINPPLTIGNLPPAVKYLALVLDDPDAVNGVYDHWVVWDIPSSKKNIEEKTTVGVVGRNSAHKNEYAGPCPPNGEHQYRFRMWGYTTPLNLDAKFSKDRLLQELDGRAIVTAELLGRYGGQR